MFGPNSLLSGLALGAGAMYFFDRAQGTRRRKLLADQFNHLASECLHGLTVSLRDLKNRSQGTVAQARSMFRDGSAEDATITQRVRSTLGHYVSHARVIEVGCSDGHVVLRGPIPRGEIFAALRAASAVPGVRTVADELTVQDHVGNGAASSNSRVASSFDFSGGNWSPGTKLLVGGAGAVLLGRCLTARRRSLTDVALGCLGFGMLARSLSSSNQDAVTFHKTLTIHSPVDKVFPFITTPGNWAQITTRIRNLQWHGPEAFSKDVTVAGIPIHFSERIVCREENSCFMTESLPDSSMPYQKQLHFQGDGENTRLHLTFTYSPPGGAIGHGIGAMFGWDAKSFFDDFLMRAKAYLETDLQSHDSRKRSHASHDAGPAVPPHEKAPNQGEGEVLGAGVAIGAVPLNRSDDL